MAVCLTNVRLSLASRSHATNAILAGLDAGAGPGRCRVYSGPRPVNPDDPLAVSNVLLADFALLKPAFDPAVNGVATLRQPVPSVQALATGIGAWVRLLDSDLNVVLDAEMGTTNVAFIVNTIQFVIGVEVALGVTTYTTPVGQ